MIRQQTARLSAEDENRMIVAALPKVEWNLDPTVWVDEHGDYLFRYALVRLRDEVRAEDAVQEALLAALQHLDSYSGRSSERTWLTGILKHKIIDQIRKACKEVPFDASDTDLSEFDPLFERDDEWNGHWSDTLSPRIWQRSPEDAVQQSEFFGVLQACIGKLPQRAASVFTLREMDELDTDEICRMLGLSDSNFWVMMHRARMSLRRCIEINWFMKAR
jgi:RNA polymerase sigma-70 factor, ECF subfamily